MRISEEQKRKIEKEQKKINMRKHLHENRDQRELRKANEYCKRNNIVNGVIGAIRKNQPYKYIISDDGCEIENTIFKKYYNKWWQRHDSQHKKYEKKETCILVEDENIIVLNTIIEYHEKYNYDREETDKYNKYIMMRLPKYKMRFEVEKINKFDTLPAKLRLDGEEEISKEELLKAILKTTVNIYEVK